MATEQLAPNAKTTLTPNMAYARGSLQRTTSVLRFFICFRLPSCFLSADFLLC